MIQVFSKEWFQKHQRKLVWFANTKIGRYTLRIYGDRSSVGKNKIVQISPNSITWIKDRKKRELQTEFRTHDKFAKRLYYAFKPFWYLFHGWDEIANAMRQPGWNLGFDTLTQYPGSIEAYNPCDGFTRRATTSETYATIIDEAGTNVFTSDIQVRIKASTTANQFSALDRAATCFDTSALTTGANISAAVYSLFGVARAFGLGTPDISVVSSAPASTSSLAVSDHSSYGSTSFAAIGLGSLSTSAYNDWTLDSNGIDNVSKDGISKFGIRDSWDIAGSFGGSWSSGQETLFSAKAAITDGTTQDPKLVVTYTLGATGASSMMLLGIG
jgi:hypothetical protein